MSSLPPEARAALASRRLGVLISGRGSNMQAIVEAIVSGRLDASVAVVVSNRPDAPGLAVARAAGLDTLVLDHTAWASREAYDGALAEALEQRGVGLVCLAGYMRLVGQGLLGRYRSRVLNVHPSLLPAFPGLHAQRQALAHGVKVAGATVHLVTEALDAGPIVRQAAVPVYDDDTEDTLAARILVEEHRLYPEAIAEVLTGAWHLDGRRFLRGQTD